MNAVHGTLFSIISNVILRGGKQNYWHPFVHLFVRASFALGEFRAVTLFVLCPPPLILCPPTPFGAMMPSTHSSSGVIDPLPLPNNAERTTDAIIPPRGDRDNENHHQGMWGRVGRLRLLLGHLGSALFLPSSSSSSVCVLRGPFLPSVRPSPSSILAPGGFTAEASATTPLRNLRPVACTCRDGAGAALAPSVHPLHDSIVHPTGPTRVLRSRVRHSGQGHAREALRGQKQNRGGVRKGGPLTDSGCGPGLTQRRRLPRRRHSVEHWWPPRDRESGSKWNN